MAPLPHFEHAAVTSNGRLYILGGYEQDPLLQLFEFDLSLMMWQNIDISANQLKNRKNHSAYFLDGFLIMLGGYDGC